jgi:hypothetical protein
LVASGCGGGPADGAGGAQSSELQANARAAAVNVSLSDLPEEFVAIPPVSGEGDAAAIDDCVEGVIGAAALTVSDVASPTFGVEGSGRLNFVASRTTILRGAEAAEDLFASLQAEPVVTCLSERLSEVLGDLLPEATPDAPLTLTPDRRFAALGNQSVRLAGATTLMPPGPAPAVPVSSSLVLLRTGEVVTLLLFGGVAEPFPPAIAGSLATAVASRQS